VTNKIRHPHIVSAGYQRLFTEDGKRIRVITKDDLARGDPAGKVISVLDNFKAKRQFLRVLVSGVADDSLEDAFALRENWAIPLLRQVQVELEPTPDQTLAIKVMMSIHWARSYAHESVRQRLQPEVLDEFIAAIPHDLELHRRFQRQYARPPKPGELAALLREQGEKMAHTRIHDVPAIIRAYNYAVTKFEDLHVELLTPASRSLQFITSDSPTVIARTPELLEVGSQKMALGDAGFVMMPIRPNLAACLSATPGHIRIDNTLMYQLNRAMVRNAVSRIAAHPRCKVLEALGRQ